MTILRVKYSMFRHNELRGVFRKILSMIKMELFANIVNGKLLAVFSKNSILDV